jgi:hypothetical protein
LRLGKSHAGQHDIAVPKRSDQRDAGKATPIRGLLVMLGSCVAFLAFLALLTIAVHFIML